MFRVFAAAAASGGILRLSGASRLSAASAAHAAEGLGLEEQLQGAAWLHLLQVPGAGRGLFAATDIEQGMVVYEESPMLCTPSPHALSSTCHACLRPLGPPSTPTHTSNSSSDDCVAIGTSSGSGSSLRFCSPSCSSAAEAGWAQAAAGGDFRALQQACREGGDKFPLMAAQLACLQVQRWQQEQQAEHGSGDSSSSSSSSSSSAAGSGQADEGSPEGGEAAEAAASAAEAAAAAGEAAPPRGDPLTQLRFLCYANLPEPPQPWVQLHRLLLQGLAPLTGSTGWRGCTEERLGRQFSLQWFCDVMARLHLNAFRVDTVPPLDLSDPAALLRAAAASLGGPAGSAAATAAAIASEGGLTAQQQQHTGSAAFLLASMLNHSCEPNLDVTWPRNNAVVRFTAARDIAAHEQLTISYVDAEQGAAQRRQALQFAYGFACRCPRCREELGGGPGGAE